jgi:hypothetical protein
MINFIKKIFRKTINEIKPRELSNNEKWLLDRLKYDWIYSGNENKEYYLLDGRLIKYLGKWSYPDVDMIRSGQVGEVIKTGEIIDIKHKYLFNKKPHDWVKLLSDNSIYYYSEELNSGKDFDYLYDKYFKQLPKEVIRDLKLKEILK